MFLNYPCNPIPTITPDNRVYTVLYSTNIKIIFLYTICHNSDVFRSALIIFRDQLNINSIYKDTTGLFKTLIFVHKMSAGITKFVSGSAELVHKMCGF